LDSLWSPVASKIRRNGTVKRVFQTLILKNRKAPPGIHAGGTLRGPQKDAGVFPDADPSTWIVASN
jgi:hypothetical protein